MSKSQMLSAMSADQIAALAGLSADQIAAIFGTTSAPTPAASKKRNTQARTALSLQVSKLRAWSDDPANSRAKAAHMPLGHRGLRFKAGVIDRAMQSSAKNLRLKLNVSFARGAACILTEDERAALHKWAFATGLEVTGHGKGVQPWILGLRFKADKTADKRAGEFFQAGGTVSVDRDNLVTFAPAAGAEELRAQALVPLA